MIHFQKELLGKKLDNLYLKLQKDRRTAFLHSLLITAVYILKNQHKTTFKKLSLTCAIILSDTSGLSTKHQYFLNANYASGEYTGEPNIVPGLIWEGSVSDTVSTQIQSTSLFLGLRCLFCPRGQQRLHPSLSGMRPE